MNSFISTLLAVVTQFSTHNNYHLNKNWAECPRDGVKIRSDKAKTKDLASKAKGLSFNA